MMRSIINKLFVIIIGIFIIQFFMISCDDKASDPDEHSNDLINSKITFSDDFSDNNWENNNGQNIWQQASWMQNETQMSVDRCQVNDGFLELTV